MKDRYTLPSGIVRFHIHMRRDHASQLVALAEELAKLKGRDTRLGEALELALTAGLSGNLEQLLATAQSDTPASPWLALGHVNRFGGKALTPVELSR
jgi:hypothetical protein